MIHTIRAIAGLLLLFSSALGLVCSSIVMLLIHRMNSWKTYHRIVFTLCAFQAIYDIAYFFLPAYDNQVTLAIYRFLATFSGIAVCMWTNVISMASLYTIAYLQPFNIINWHRIALQSTLVISTAFAGIFLLVSLVKDADATMDYLYFFFRAVSTLFNIVIFCVLYFIFNRPACASCIDRWFSHYDFTMRDMTQDLLAVLSTKLMYYPVVQILSRIVCLWWEYRYGFTVTAFDQGDYSLRKAGAMLLYALFSPSAGSGYLLIFLYVHGQARHALYEVCRDIYFFVFGCCTKHKNNPNNANIHNKDGSSLAASNLKQHNKNNDSNSSKNTNDEEYQKLNEDNATTISSLTASTSNTAKKQFTGSTMGISTTTANAYSNSRESHSSTTVERDSVIFQVNPIVNSKKSTSASYAATNNGENKVVSYATSADNPIVTVRHHNRSDSTNSSDVNHNNFTATNGGNNRFPLHPSATGFEQRVFHEHWTIAAFAYDMDEQVIWEEFFRRKLERESMTVHHDRP